MKKLLTSLLLSALTIGASFGQSIDLSVDVNTDGQPEVQPPVVYTQVQPVAPRIYDSYGYMENGVYYKRVPNSQAPVPAVLDSYALSQERNNARWPALYGRP